MVSTSVLTYYFLAAAAALSMQHSTLVECFSVSPSTKTSPTALAAVAFSTPDDSPFGGHPNRRAEFEDLEPVSHSKTRQARMKEDRRLRRRFAKYGDDLWSLRKVMTRLSHNLVKAMNGGSHDREEEIREQLREMQVQDPELVYKVELENMNRAHSEGRLADSEEHGRSAMAARSQLPQYNLDGLWVGKYGHHGYEIINITYAGDTMIAYKVTGDNNVPRGEVTFQVNLDPMKPRRIGKTAPGPDETLQPIALTEKASKKWGTTELPRYQGLGQVAEPGFSNTQWMDGQLIIIGEEYFSFAWVPIEQQIFFGRPSPELALKMLRESSTASNVGANVWDKPPSVDDDVTVLKSYVASCLEKTSEAVEEELEGDAFSCIWHGMGTEERYFQ